jgi:hypothetical protein
VPGAGSFARLRPFVADERPHHCTIRICEYVYAAVDIFVGWNWYKRLYAGCKNNSTASFVCFFINFFMHCLFFGLGTVGPVPQVAMTGYMMMITSTCNFAPGASFLVLEALLALAVISGPPLSPPARHAYSHTHPLLQALGATLGTVSWHWLAPCCSR